MKTIGLDIGTNSVGSCWIDDEAGEIKLAVSVFPAGVEVSDSKRGAPKNQKRRQSRSQRRSINRKAKRRHQLLKFVVEKGFLPTESSARNQVMDSSVNPWLLRKEALERELKPYEFARILIHMNQRRGALGINADSEDPEEGKVKEAIDALRKQLNGKTVGQFMADLYDSDVSTLSNGTVIRNAIRNRRDSFRFHADRGMIREEFHKIWKYQSGLNSELSKLLTTEILLQLDNPKSSSTWREQGLLFGQRNTYWDTGTLGRCDLEPTEHRCPEADMDAQEFRVLEYVNNIRVEPRGDESRPLTDAERVKVIDALNSQKTATVSTVRKALGFHTKDRKAFFSLNIDRDSERKPNVNWFHRTIISGVFGEETWHEFGEQKKKSINNAILKFQPDRPDGVQKLTAGCKTWWGLSDEQSETFITAWMKRPKTDKRVALSRTALQKLLPFLRDGRSVSEARQRYAEYNAHSDLEKERYSLGKRSLSSAEKHFLKKHPGLLPPAPTCSNPVVRKAIHEVRRHLNEYIRTFGKPDRVVIELARSARQSEKVRNEQLNQNRSRNSIREKIEDEFGLTSLSKNQIARGIQRVLLCRQQKGICAYTGETITEAAAANGNGLEVDHIVPRSRSNDNGMNNKVLVRMDANRDKGSRTIREWLGADSQAFAELQQRLSHIKEGKPVEKYFGKRDYKRKWENLIKDSPGIEDFMNSQLSDTAYASREVASYIREALFHDVSDDERPVMTTKGHYTAILRRDWGLLEGDMERENKQLASEGAPSEDATRIARRDEKDRRDHVHHAIDAVAIAFCTGQTIRTMAKAAEQQEHYRAEKGRWSRRGIVPTPWGTVESFRQQVLGEAKQLVIAHRPVKRKLVGAFHQETLYGPVLDDLPVHRTEKHTTLFTNRIPVEKLKPSHLRVPEGWDGLWAEFLSAKTKSQRTSLRRQMARLKDPSPSKSGIVRDRELRSHIRTSLRDSGLNPDKFSEKDAKLMAERQHLKMPSGTPIFRVILLQTHTAPVIITRQTHDMQLGRIPDAATDSRSDRVYIGGNNHHVAIYEDLKSGKWTGEFVSMFEAARRVRVEKRTAVDRNSNEKRRFLFSIAEGETVFCRRPNDHVDHSPEHYVVMKLDKTRNRIVFAPHWDARPASAQQRWEVTPSKLKSLAASDASTIKTQISALGTQRLLKD